MYKLIIKLLAVFVALILMSMTQCENEEDFVDLVVVNNTNDTLLHYIKSDTILWEQTIYPTDKNKELHWILPNSTINLKDEYEPQLGAIYFFLFDKHVIDTIPWENVRDDYLILRRFDLTESDLVNGGWEVTYP